MGFFSTLFGGDDSKKAAVLNGLDIMDAINAHVKWKLRLEKYVGGTSEEILDPDVICRDDQCTLGKWIHGSAYEHFQGDQGLNTLREDHAKFHLVASQIVTLVQQDNKNGAEALLKGEYLNASRRVVHDLTELNKQLGQNE